MQRPLKLMGILAHPDDESIAFGGTFARYAAEGIETSLIVATRGERGWFFNWDDYPGPQALGAIREQELRDAAHFLGITHLEFLNYIDGDLDQAPEHEIMAQLVYFIRTIQPDVIITFGPEGLYGHPDHIAISQFTTSAILCAADPTYTGHTQQLPHRVSKLYYRVSPSSWFDRFIPHFGDMIMSIDGQERRAFPWANWAITTRLDTNAYWQTVWQAVRCHHTQIPADEILDQVSEEELRFIWGSQEYYRVFSLVNGGRREEHDLFEGLRSSIPIIEPVLTSSPLLVTSALATSHTIQTGLHN